MKREDFVSTLAMTTVCILMLVGVTIAWYTSASAQPITTGMQMSAKEQKGIRIALTPGGKDILELEEGQRYAKIGLEELLNIEEGFMAPGAYGEVLFYITSLNKEIVDCQVVPSLQPRYERDFENDYGGVVPEDTVVTINNQDKKIVDVLEKHFDFYSNADMTQTISLSKPMEIELINNTTLPWNEEIQEGTEVPVTIYWKWHYEYPFTSIESDTMSNSQKEDAIYDYDMEDTWIGTHISTMRFRFNFLVE